MQNNLENYWNDLDSRLEKLIEYGAVKLPSLKQFHLEKLSTEISDEMKDQVVIAKHNIDENPNTPTTYGIRGIPTMLLFSGGKLKATKVGATTKSNIVSWIKENI